MNNPSPRKLYHQTYRQQYRQIVKRINCTLTRHEYAELCEHASKSGLKPTVYLKETSLAYLNQTYIVPQNIENRLQELIFLLRNIGNNVNQLAAKANKFKTATVFDLLKAKKNLNELEEIIKNFIRNPEKQTKINDHQVNEQKDREFFSTDRLCEQTGGSEI